MTIRPATNADVQRIAQAALADYHPAFAPSHLLENDAGEIRGYFSVAGITPLLFWSHTGNDRFNSLRFAKAAVAAARATRNLVLLPCSAASPFVPVLPGLGFEKIGPAEFWRLK